MEECGSADFTVEAVSVMVGGRNNELTYGAGSVSSDSRSVCRMVRSPSSGSSLPTSLESAITA